MSMDYIGLTLEAEKYILDHSLHFAGTYVWKSPNGYIERLRIWRQFKYPMTCSCGGATEVPQILMGKRGYQQPQLYTALISSLWEHSFDTVPGKEGYYMFQPLIDWDNTLKEWALTKKIPARALVHAWKPTTLTKNEWECWSTGLLPAEFFDPKYLLTTEEEAPVNA